MTFNIDNLLSSALPSVIRCSANCGATAASFAKTADGDDPTVLVLRDRGWQVVEGQWTCPDDLPAERQNLPGAMGRRRNVHCSNCGDTRGGAYGHEAYECTCTARA
jgi:hypothetical protein